MRGFQRIYGLRGPWGLTAVIQLIYELRKNCCGTGGREKSKALQEVFADLKRTKRENSKLPNCPLLTIFFKSKWLVEQLHMLPYKACFWILSSFLSLVISICYRMNHCLSAYKAIILVEHFKSRVLVKLKGLIHVTRCSNHASVAKLMVSETTALLPKFHYAMILVTYFILSRYVQRNVFQCFLPCLTKHFVFLKVFLKAILNCPCFIINTVKF